MGISFAARTDIGRKRRRNEDFFAVDQVRGLFLVADGLGGHVAGRTASEIASYRFCDAIRLAGEASPLDTVRDAFHQAHEAIHERVAAQPDLAGMGTTLVCVWMRDGHAVLGHVGDSRIYLLRRGTLHSLTYDHSLVSELIFRGQLSPEEARGHPYRHVITRALGVAGPMEPDLAELRCEAGDVFVLCTDGITSPIEDEELAALLGDCKGDWSLATEKLIELANERGGDDNATAVIVSVD